MTDEMFRAIAENSRCGITVFDSSSNAVWTNTDGAYKAAAAFTARDAAASGRSEAALYECGESMRLETAVPVRGKDGAISYVIAEEIDLDALDAERKRALTDGGVYKIEECPQEHAGALEGDALVAESRAMSSLKSSLDALSHHDSSVIIQGADGSGKTVAARYLSSKGRRAGKPFVILTAEEAEQNGAADRAFFDAEGGTVLLDAPDELSPAAQRAVFEASEAHREVRITAATSRDLFKMAASGRFDLDLYVRIATKALSMPSLDERAEDIDGLIKGFASRDLSDDEMRSLKEAITPGMSAAKLRESVEELMKKDEPKLCRVKSYNSDTYSASKETKAFEGGVQAFPRGKDDAITHDWEGFSLSGYIDDIERKILSEALAEGGSTYKAARLLGVNQSTVVRKKQKLGL